VKKKKPNKVRKFVWLDHSSSSDWQSMAEILKWVENTKNKPCHTTGRIIYEDDMCLVVSNEGDGEGNYGLATLIFKALLIK